MTTLHGSEQTATLDAPIDYHLISADCHVFEVPDLWSSLQPKYGDRAPHLESREDGDWWFGDGLRLSSTAGGSQAGMRFEQADKMGMVSRWERVVRGAYDPDERLKEQDRDTVSAEIIFPTVGLRLYSHVTDSQLLTDACRVYNDWIAEFCGAHPDRLKGIAMINVDVVEDGVAELQRARRKGLVGAMITVYPPEERPYWMDEYAPLWSAAEDLDMPLSLHNGTNRPGPLQYWQQMQNPVKFTSAYLANFDFWVRMSLGHMIMTGVFERHPKLHAGTVEHDLGWIPHFLQTLDHQYTQGQRRPGWHRFKSDAIPSDFFRSNCFASFQEDPIGIELRRHIGVHTLMWGSDYPHPECTYPRSRQILDELHEGVPLEEKALVAGGNAARMYHLEGF